jgi:hypothetical protein
MGMLWKEEMEPPAHEAHHREHVVGIIREEMEIDEPDALLEDELAQADDAEAYPHIVPIATRLAHHHAR